MAETVAETLAEELLLLAHDIRGKCRIAPVELDCGVGGALLSELRLAGRLGVTNSTVTVTDDAPVGDPLLDELLADLAAASRTPREWVTHLRRSGYGERLLARMADQGRIEIDPRRTLGVFTETRYPVRDIVALWEAQQRVVSAVTSEGEPGPRTLALGAVASAAGLAKPLFYTAGNWRELRARMRAMTEGDWAAEAVRDVLAADRGRVTV